MFEQYKKESPIISLLGMGGGVGSYIFTAPDTGYEIARSLRFNSADSAYLSRTPASAGNRKTWTWAGWVKRCDPGQYDGILEGGTSNPTFVLAFRGSDDLVVSQNAGTSAGWVTSAVFRDPSAWYHIVVAVDTTSATSTITNTSTDRFRLYVNGVQQTLSGGSVPSQNADLQVNNTVVHSIGRNSITPAFSNLYLADVHFIDGQALDPTSFGLFDDYGIWQPKLYTGTYGTNGFHLPFSDNSTAAALGTDSSGNGNTWTVNNISVGDTKTIEVGTPTYPSSFTTTGDKTSDQTALSYVYWSGTYTGAVTKIFRASDSSVFTTTINISGPTNDRYLWYSDDSISWTYIGNLASLSRPYTLSGHKYYATSEGSASSTITVGEIPSNNDSLVDVPTNGTEEDTGVGGEVRGNYATLNPLGSGTSQSLSNGNLDIVSTSTADNNTPSTIGMSSGKWYFEVTIVHIGNTTGGEYAIGLGKDLSPNMVIGNNATSWAYASSGEVRTNSSNSSYGASYTTGDVLGAAFDADAGTLVFYKNGVSQGNAATGIASGTYFFLTGTYVSSSARSVNFGQRPFAYTAPSGFKALCTQNLDDPLVAQPSTVMDVKLWTGNGSSQTISGLGFSPDLVWIKARSQGIDWHALFNTVVGATTRLFSNSASAEATNAQTLTAFNSDGFSVGNTSEVNGSSTTYVGWCWDAGSSTVTNTDGSITSSVRANPSAGFSIVGGEGDTFFGGSLGHGLGVAPAFILTKDRDNTNSWYVYHKNLTNPNNYYLFLNSTSGEANYGSNLWNVTSTTFLSDQGLAGRRGVSYCFAPVDGYSSFGSYVGNGSGSDNAFVYTGFRPKWVMIKSTGSGSWPIMDAARDTYNATGLYLWSDLSNAEADNRSLYPIDFLSNGFKIRNSAIGASSTTYIYAAFAENPFKTARAR